MKHTIAKSAFFFLLICILFNYCKKDTRNIDQNLTAVPALFAPDDNVYIKLDPTANPTHVFQWDQARAADGSLVLYEVAFDQAGGDFSKPFYTKVSDGGGVQNQLTLTDGDLSKIAALGGAAFFERKQFIWTVLASKGTNVVPSAESRTIDLERPGGFDVLPSQLYITGNATEGGDVLANALQMKQTAAGEFEIFTKLKPGTYQFVNAKTGTPDKYYTFTKNGALTIGVDSMVTYTDTPKIVRINLDFNNINATYATVKTMQFWYGQANDVLFTLPYESNGLWRYNGWTVNLLEVAWGLEDRYKYKMVIDDGTGDKDQWVNSTFNDPPGQDGQYPSSVDYRSIDLSVNNNSQYDWGWKFDRNYLTQGSVADFWVSLRGSDSTYTQNYQKE